MKNQKLRTYKTFYVLFVPQPPVFRIMCAKKDFRRSAIRATSQSNYDYERRRRVGLSNNFAFMRALKLRRNFDAQRLPPNVHLSQMVVCASYVHLHTGVLRRRYNLKPCAGPTNALLAEMRLAFTVMSLHCCFKRIVISVKNN